jgi:WD40 repeat protein
MLVLPPNEAPADGEKGDKPANPAVVVLEARKPSNLGNRRPDSREWIDLMRIQRVVFSGDGTRLVAVARWGVVVWDVTTGKVVFESPTPQPEERLPIMSEANLLLLPTKGFAAIDLLTGAQKKEKYPRLVYGGAANLVLEGEAYYVHPHAHSMAPDASLYALVAMQHPWGATGQTGKKGKDFGKDIGLQPDQVVVTELRTGKVKFTLTAQLQPPKASEGPDARKNAPKTWTTAFSNDSKYLAACTEDGCVTVWEMNKGEEVAVFRSIASYSGQFAVDQAMMAWVGDHESLIVPGAVAGGFFRCNLATKIIQPLESQQSPKPAAAKKGAPGKKPGKPGQLPPPSPSDGRLTGGHGPDTGDAYAFSRNGRHLIKTSHNFNEEGRWLHVSDLTRTKAGGVIPGIKGDRAWSFGFSPDSQRLAIGTARGNVLIYGVADFYELARKGALLETGLAAQAPSAEANAESKAAENLKKIGADVSGYPVVFVDCSSLDWSTGTLISSSEFRGT